MTDFKDLKLIYNEYSSLVDEITSMIKEEDFSCSNDKLEQKEKLMKKLAMAKKTTNLSPEQEAQTQQWEDSLRERETNNIKTLSLKKDDVALELNKSRKKEKMSNAYNSTQEKSSGILIDYEE